LADFLIANGYEIVEIKPRFMPLTIKSRLAAAGPSLPRLANETTRQANAVARAAEEPMKMQLMNTDHLFIWDVAAAHKRNSSLQWATLTTFAIVTALLVWRVRRYVGFVACLLPLPYSIDYGEGIVMQQAMMIPSPRMYGDINVYPYIVFHYPPLYHLIARAIALLGNDLLYAGRWLSIMSAVTTAGFVGALIFCSIRQRLPTALAVFAAAIGGATVFTYLPIAVWSSLMRVDMFAVALSFAGVYLAVLGTRRPALVYGAALAFALSIYTKQTMIAAPAATFSVLWLREPRLVRAPIVLGFGLSVAALVWLSWETNGGFLRHIVLYNVNRFSIAHALERWPLVIDTLLYLFVAILFGLVHSWRRLCGLNLSTIREHVRRCDEAMILAIITIWFCFGMVSLVGVGKVGADLNYFIEWMCVWSVLIGVAIGNAFDAMGRCHRAPAIVLLVPILLAAQLLLLIPLPGTMLRASVAAREAMNQLFRIVQEAQKPVLSDDMVLLLRARKQVPLEPAIFAELGSLGRWDQRKFVELIDSRAFAFIISQGGPGTWLYNERYTKPVQAAIAVNYPHQERYADYVVMKP
jgi:hypothetical protein